MKTRWVWSAAVVTGVWTLAAPGLLAQQANGAPDGVPGAAPVPAQAPGNGINVNPNDPLGYVQEQAGFTDDEWKVIEPKLQRVIDAQQAAGTGGNRGGGRRGRGFGADATPTGTGAVAQAQANLNVASNDPNTTAQQYKDLLQALRDAKDKAKVALTAAQDDLRKELKPKQEATLVTLGYLG